MSFKLWVASILVKRLSNHEFNRLLWVRRNHKIHKVVIPLPTKSGTFEVILSDGSLNTLDFMHSTPAGMLWLSNCRSVVGKDRCIKNVDGVDCTYVSSKYIQPSRYPSLLQLVSYCFTK